MTKMPTLLFFSALFYWISHGHGRPQLHAIYRRAVDEEIIKRVSEEVSRHSISDEDYKKLNLPPITESTTELSNEGPHNFHFINDGFGNYNFTVNTLLLKRSEVGEVKNAGSDNEILVVKGQFEIRTIIKKEVLLIRTIGYIADENGFRTFLTNIRFAVSPQVLQDYGKPELSSIYKQQTYDELIKGVIKDANSYLGFNTDIEKLDFPIIIIENDQKLRTKNPHYFSFANNGSGNYYFSANTFSLKRSEVGEIKNPGTENEILIIKGQYEIRTKIKKDLLIIRNIGYIIDESGFRSFLIGVKLASTAPFVKPTIGPPLYMLQPSEPFIIDKGERKGISSSCLASLCGGNIG